MTPASTPTRMTVAIPPARCGAVALLFFVSGAIALVYEIVWQRQFALLFGSAAPATAAVLAGYFAGLGTGAFVVGRVAARWMRPLRIYAILEIAVGLGALLVAPLLAGFDQAYPRLFELLAGRPELFLGARLAVVFGVILIPTFCMGGTLPVLGALADRGQKRLGRTAGWLYVVNTAGAGLGALAFPFLLLPQLGLTGTVWLCAAMNGGLGIAAWVLDRNMGAIANPSAAPAAESNLKVKKGRSATETASINAMPRSSVALVLISGTVTFALQVLWNRAFAQIHENSMYSFSVIVAVVIFALALGAQLARFCLGRGVDPRRLIGGAWIFGGLSILAGPWLFLRLSNELSYLAASGGWTNHAIQLAGLAVAVLLSPMALLGVGLPAIMEQAGRTSNDGAARVLGRLLALNVAGSVTGALAAGFILPQWLGLWNSVIWLGSSVLMAGLWQWTRWRNSAQYQKFGLILGAGWLAALWPVTRLDLPRVRLASDQGE